MNTGRAGRRVLLDLTPSWSVGCERPLWFFESFPEDSIGAAFSRLLIFHMMSANNKLLRVSCVI